MKLNMLLVAALTAIGLSAQARTVELNVTVDASQVINFNSPNWYTGAPFALSSGDTLTVAFSFLPGQALEIAKPMILGMATSAVDADTSFEVQQRTSLEFIGLQGPALNPPSAETRVSGTGVMHFFFADDFMAAPDATISFTGLKFGVDIQSFSDAAVDRAFYSMALLVAGENIRAVSAVPEPASYGLLALGLGMLGLRTREKA